MATTVKVRNGVVTHTHPTIGNPKGRIHWGWEIARGDPKAHDRENASKPTNLDDLSPEMRTQYFAALKGQSFEAIARAPERARKAQRETAAKATAKAAAPKKAAPALRDRFTTTHAKELAGVS